MALDKKEEVLELCNTESKEFTHYIEEQLNDLLSARDQYIIEGKLKDQGQGKRGNELQEQVTKSIKDGFNKRVPHIINIVR
jgi:hypothetical protein